MSRRKRLIALLIVFALNVMIAFLIIGCKNFVHLPILKNVSMLDSASIENPRNSESSAIVLVNGDLLIAYVHFFGINDYDKSQIWIARSIDGGNTF